MIKIDEENKVVQYENEPNVQRQLFPNIPLTVDVSPLQDAIDALDDRMDDAENDIDSIMTTLQTFDGQPGVAETVSDMTDTNKIYVYVGSEAGYTSGDWYYYDGSDWVSGGTYVANPVTVDDTLSVSGDAADAKVTGDEIAQIKSDLSDLYLIDTVTASAIGNQYCTFPIVAGHIYLFTSTSSGSISIATVDQSNTTVENVGNTSAGTDKTLLFTATSNAPKILCYFRASGSVRVEDMSLKIPVIEAEVDALEVANSALEAKVVDYEAYNVEINRKFIQASSSGNYYITYPLTKGVPYKITTSCPTNSVTIATVDASNTKIEDIDTLSTGTHSVTFVPTENAAKVWFYFRAAGVASVTEQSTVGQPWVGQTWSNYGDSISWLHDWHIYVNILTGMRNYIRNGKPGASISWSSNTFGIDANGIYTTDSPADTVHEGMCAYDRISKTIDNSLPLIFVMGGTNDFLLNTPLGDTDFDASELTDDAWHTANPIGDYDITTFKGAMASMLMKLQYHAPNALVVFGTLLNGIGASTGVNQYAEQTNTLSLKPSDYAEAEKEVCRIFGVPCIDVFSECGINIANRSTYISDTVHPNSAGMKLLGRCVASGLSKMFPRSA